MEFDDEWIKSFEEKQKTSKQTLKVFYCYIDNDNVMQKINQEVIDVKNKILTKDEVVKLIIRNKKKHELINILTYIVKDVDSSTNYNEFMKDPKKNIYKIGRFLKIENVDVEEMSSVIDHSLYRHRK